MKKLALLFCVALLSCSKEKEQCYECTTKYYNSTTPTEVKSTQCNMTEEGIRNFEKSASSQTTTPDGVTSIVTRCK